MARTIDVVSLYPKDMNIYGDSGNVLTIRRRLELYGYEPVGPTRWTLFWEAAAKTPARRKSSTTSTIAPTCCVRLPQTVRRC